MSQPTRVAVIAALPREIRLLTKGISPDTTLLDRGVHLYRLNGALILAAGMGAGRAAVAFESALATGALGIVISAGLAGSCSANLVPGSVAEASMVIDPRTGEHFRTASAGGSTVLATTTTIASVGEKARLAASYSASMVDMEAATIARLAAAHGMPFRAIKGISDAHDFELASLSRFEGRHGQFRTAAFALHTALRPHHWRPAARLGRESNRALAALHEVLQKIIADAG